MFVSTLQTAGIYACHCSIPDPPNPPYQGGQKIQVGILAIDWVRVAPRVRLVQRQNLCPPVWVAVPVSFRNSGIEVLNRVELEIVDGQEGTE